MARGDRTAPGPGRSRQGRAGAGERARGVSSPAVNRVASRFRARRRRADARVLPLDVRIDVDARSVRDQAEPRVLLPDRRRPQLAARAAGRTPSLLQLPYPVAHLDPRGLSGPLPALPASAAGRIEGPQVDLLRARLVCRRVGALLRADDG